MIEELSEDTKIDNDTVLVQVQDEEKFEVIPFQVKNAGWTVKGDMYVYDIWSFCMAENGFLYTWKYCIRIESDI